MNRNLYYYQPYDKANKYINKSNRNNNFLPNNHKNGHFQPNNFLYMNNRNSYHQGILNRSNNKNNDNSSVREREKNLYNGEEMHAERYWKRKGNSNNNNWTKTPKPIKVTPAATVDHYEETPVPPKWCKEDAIKAIEIEQAFSHLQSNQYVLRFPDPPINKSMIQGFSSAIVDVRVQQPITPRYVIFIVCV